MEAGPTPPEGTQGAEGSYQQTGTWILCNSFLPSLVVVTQASP